MARALVRAPEGDVLQRLFSTFPSGWPGAGLLLLRAAGGLSLSAEGAARLSAPGPSVMTWGLDGLLLACGLLLVAGFLTPIAGLTGSAALIAQLAMDWGRAASAEPGLLSSGATLLALIVAVAIVLLGPGALSFDCWLFGRREIVIPPDRRPLP